MSDHICIFVSLFFGAMAPDYNPNFADIKLFYLVKVLGCLCLNTKGGFTPFKLLEGF